MRPRDLNVLLNIKDFHFLSDGLERGVIKKFVDWRDKNDTMLDRTFKFCIFPKRDILHMIANYQFI